MFLVIDNYDSFTYNLVHFLGEIGVKSEVVRNDAVTVEEVLTYGYEGIVISPGPCTPFEAGICLDLISKAQGTIPMLGVCLGHQAIAQAYGGEIIRAQTVMHGKTSEIIHDQQGIFDAIPSPFVATRYHSLIAERASLPKCLKITATTKDDVIMGLEHQTAPVFGVQFHPESIASQWGHQLLRNFSAIARN